MEADVLCARCWRDVPEEEQRVVGEGWGAVVVHEACLTVAEKAEQPA